MFTGKRIRKFYGEAIGPFDAIMGALALIFCFLTMYYADITVTCRFGLTFIDSLFDGKPLSFYANALSSGIAPEGAVYDIGTYIIFGIWGLPVWILNKVAGVSALSIGSLLWFKLLLVVFLAGTVRVIARIAAHLGFTRYEQAAVSILYLLSSTVILPIFVVAQYDILALFFLLLAIYYHMEHKENLFYLWIAVSMTIKPLTILILLLMILLYEKNILHICMDLLKGSSLMILCKAIYSLSPAYRESCSGFLQKNLANMFTASIPGSYSDVSIFILGLILIYIVAYLHDMSGNQIKEFRTEMILGFAVWATFCAFGSMTAYWTIYMAPFAIITAFMGKRNRNKMLLLDLVENITLTVLLTMRYTWVYGGDKTFSYLLLKPFCTKVLSGGQGTTVAGVLRRVLAVDKYPSAIAAVMVACMVTILYLAWKENERKEEADQEGPVSVWHFRGRIALYYIWIIITSGALFLTITGR